MADDVLAEKVFNYICGSGGFVELHVLLKHSSPLGSRKSKAKAKNWLMNQPDRRLVVVKDFNGEIAGVRIDLRRKICRQYHDQGSCGSAQGKCNFWHICKGFIEENCHGKCNRSHNFFDPENKEKTKELGLAKYPNGTLKHIVAWSLPQVCELYTRGKCTSDSCLYLHLCSQAVRSSACSCSLSHDLTDSHNMKIMKQYDLVPHQSMSTDFVRCNILVPKKQPILHKAHDFLPSVCNAGENFSKKAMGVIQGTKKQSPEVSTPSRLETTKSPFNEKQSSYNNSKEFDAACSFQDGTEFEKKNCSSNLLQEKTTKSGAPICKQTDRINNLTSNAVSPSSESRLELSNIQTGDDSDSSFDENEPANRNTKAVGSKYDKKNSVDAMKGGGLKQNPINKMKNELDGNDSIKWEQGSLVDSSRKDPNIDQSQKKKSRKSVTKEQQTKAKTQEVGKNAACMKGLSTQQPKSLEASRDTKDGQRQHESNRASESANKGRFVEAWLTSRDFVVESTFSCTDSHRLPTSQEVESGRQRKLSVSSSCSSVQDSRKFSPSKKAVFDCIVKEYNGTVSFDVISKRQDLFPNGCGDIAKWFGARSKESFLIREKEGIIYEVSAFCRKARFCFKEKCSQKDCQYFHVCREYIAGFCRRGIECQRNHCFQYDQDRKFISKLKLDGFTEEQLRNVFQLSTPQVCLDYNNFGICTNGLSCNQVHICKDFIKKRCFDEEDCILLHESAFAEAHTTAVLQNYGMRVSGDNFNSVLRTLLVCQENISSGLKDPKGNITAKGVATKGSKGVQRMSSIVGVAASAPAQPAEVKVFECLCNEYDCSASFSVISKRTDLFPSEFKDVEAWFRSKKGSFLITEDDHGKITKVDAFSTKARLCLSYNNSHHEECTRDNCSYLHVCREYITDSCNNGATCPRNHNFHDERERALLSKIKLDKLTDEQLRKLVLSSSPQICVEYNNGSCDLGESCSKIHMCREHLKKCFRRGYGCDLLHEEAMNIEHTQAILERFQLGHHKSDLVKKIILVCEQRKKSACSKEKTTGILTGHILVNEPDAPICAEFIVSKCKNGSKCTGHHCSLPYHWQYSNAGEWKSFNEKDNEKLETLYCDVTLEECSATGMQISFESYGFLFLDEICQVDIFLDNKLLITQEYVERLMQLRRLSTESDVNSSNPLATEWIWYWQDENGFWRMYDQDHTGNDLQESLERAYLNKKNDFKFRIADQDYILNFNPSSDMSQTNVKYGTTKKVRRRPGKFVSKDDISQLKRSQNAVSVLQRRNTRVTNTPNHWSSMQSKRQYQRVSLSRLSEEFKEVEKLFKKSIKRSVVIVGIERVQNPFMWEKYQRKKENMAAARIGSTKGRFVNERQLFHGTNPEIVEAICKQNYDWRLHGKNATVYGEGSYFALNSSYSDSYAKEDTKGSEFMFVAKVLVGSYTKGQSSYRRPPSKEPSNPASDLYDSCVDDRSSPTIFVVFDTDQFYPEYVIEYTTARGGHRQPAGPARPVARAPAPTPRHSPAAKGVATKVHYNVSSPSTSYQTTSTSSVRSRVQAPYSGLSGTGGYTSTSNTTSANYYHSPIAGVSASNQNQSPPTASTSTSYAYSGGSSNHSVSPSLSRSSSPAHKPKKHKSSSKKNKCLVM
ncbi:uncharacterized protein [Porites lutea]|uniref:uncharacterized protein n=1 Tax=Porites lutea TaxID=51062 RepID=UPI003CC63DC0